MYDSQVWSLYHQLTHWPVFTKFLLLQGLVYLLILLLTLAATTTEPLNLNWPNIYSYKQRWHVIDTPVKIHRSMPEGNVYLPGIYSVS